MGFLKLHDIGIVSMEGNEFLIEEFPDYFKVGPSFILEVWGDLIV
jgi:hypothetical protein